MMATIINRTLSSAVARFPLIRFRYGASRDQHKVSPHSSTGPTNKASNTNAEPIYDFQIPRRWKRRPISEEEIAYINRGGPE